MLIKHNVFESRCFVAALLQQILGRRRLPFHFLKVNVATRIHNIIAAHEINVSIRPEYDGVSAMEFDSFDVYLLRIKEDFLYCIMLGLSIPISFLLLFLGQEGFLQFIDTVLAGQYVGFG